ncbi:MAG: hypothetical protein AAFU77_05870 [Myxococcota bacterium]
MSVSPPALPQARRRRVYEILGALEMSTSRERERLYQELQGHRTEALEALAAVFPGPVRLDGDFRGLLIEPLSELSPSLDALRVFGSAGLDVLERFSVATDVSRRLAVVRVAFEFTQARAGQLLAKLTLDREPEVAAAACQALLEGRHPGGLHTARGFAVERLEKDLSGSNWEACLRLEAGDAIRIAAGLSGRKLKPHLQPLSVLTWHPPSHLPPLLSLVAGRPPPPLVRLRCLALCHPHEAVSHVALERLARTNHAALAFAPGASELLRRGVAERFKQALFEL